MSLFPYLYYDYGELRGITAGPDGNLWVTTSGCRGCQTVSKVSTTTGMFVGSVLLPGLFQAPGAIVTGPDNNLWFIEPDRDTVGRVTPSLVLTEFPTGLSGCRLDDLVSDGGALWFTAAPPAGSSCNLNRGALVKMETDGRVTGYIGLPYSGGRLPLTSNDQGTFWSVNAGMTQTFPGQYTFSIPDPHPVHTLGRGLAMNLSDGNIWYPDAVLNALVKFETI